MWIVDFSIDLSALSVKIISQVLRFPQNSDLELGNWQQIGQFIVEIYIINPSIMWNVCWYQTYFVKSRWNAINFFHSRVEVAFNEWKHELTNTCNAPMNENVSMNENWRYSSSFEWNENDSWKIDLHRVRQFLWIKLEFPGNPMSWVKDSVSC